MNTDNPTGNTAPTKPSTKPPTKPPAKPPATSPSPLVHRPGPWSPEKPLYAQGHPVRSGDKQMFSEGKVLEPCVYEDQPAFIGSMAGDFGYSGSPLIDKRSGQVIGLVIGKQDGNNRAIFISSSFIQDQMNAPRNINYTQTEVFGMNTGIGPFQMTAQSIRHYKDVADKQSGKSSDQKNVAAQEKHAQQVEANKEQPAVGTSADETDQNIVNINVAFPDHFYQGTGFVTTDASGKKVIVTCRHTLLPAVNPSVNSADPSNRMHYESWITVTASPKGQKPRQARVSIRSFHEGKMDVAVLEPRDDKLLEGITGLKINRDPSAILGPSQPSAPARH
jgi:hypothetical protein